MANSGNWRSEGTERTYGDHSYSDFAQEFLRRNDSYRRDYSRIARSLAHGDMTEAMASRIVSKWGLVFRIRS